MRLRGNSEQGDERVPRLGRDIDPAGLPLSPIEGYLLSRIDGHTPWRLLRQIGGLAPKQVDQCLERWLAEGVLELDGERAKSSAPPPPSNGSATGAGSKDAAPAPPAPERAEPAQLSPDAVSEDHPDLDASLEMPIETQRQVIAFESRLESSYYDILGVPRDADAKALKRAYFKLSKRFHPDRYFRRQIGPYAERLDRVFKRIVEAYELLSDPTARAEVEKSLAAAQASPAALAGAASESGARGASRAPRRRGPHVFSFHNRLMKERKAKAKRLFEAGMASFAAGRWMEAAGGVRLAVAFDPWNKAYKEHFAEVQCRAHEERARQLVKEAEAALDLRDYAAALATFEEALHYRPHDPELQFRAARIAWLTGSDLRQAKEWALGAVELEPDQAPYRRLLGQIYKAAGLDANARRELEAALKLDPKDEEARSELRSLGGRLQAPRWLGGKG